MTISKQNASSDRRTLLKGGTLATLLAGIGLAEGSASARDARRGKPEDTEADRAVGHSPVSRCRFDVHAHYVPPGVAQLKPAGGHFAASPMPPWSPEIALAFMDRHGIATQMLSIPVALPPAAARAANTYGAQIVKRFPERFGLLAALPMTDIAATLAEIDHAFEVLGADGAIMMTNYGGDYLGSPKYEPVFAALDHRGATVFVHPADPACFDCVSCGRPGPVIEFPMDTCRTVTDMAYANVIDRFGSINFILSHGGGALPGLAQRIAYLGVVPFVPHSPTMTPESTLAQFRKLYYDTAIAGSASSVRPVLELTNSDHIVFGSDYPPATEGIIRQNIELLEGLTFLSEAERASIGQNGRRLFRRFRETGEAG